MPFKSPWRSALRSTTRTAFFGGGGGGPTITAVEALYLNQSLTGVPTGTTLKRFGVDTTPTGVTYNATTVTVAGAAADLVGWDFQGRKLQLNANAVIGNIRNNLIVEPAASGWFWLIDIYAGAQYGSIDHNTLIANGLSNPSLAAVIGERTSGTGAAAISPIGGVIEYNKLIGYPNDAIKSSSGTIQRFNYLDTPRNLPYEPPTYSALMTYALGDYVQSGGFCYRSLANGNLGNALPTGLASNASWANFDPHSDGLNPFAIISADLQMSDNYINFSNRNRVYGTGFAWGLTNGIRLDQDNGSTLTHRPATVRRNVVAGFQNSVSFPISIGAPGANPNWSPKVVTENWVGLNANGFMVHPNWEGTGSIWSGNVAYTQPDRKLEPVPALATLDRFENLTNRTVSGTGLQTVEAPVVEGAASLGLRTNGTRNVFITNTDIGIAEAPTSWDLMAVAVDMGDDPALSGGGINVRPIVITGGITYSYVNDTTIAGTVQPVFSDYTARGVRWRAFAASRLRNSTWAGATLNAAPSGVKQLRFEVQQSATCAYDGRYKVDAAVRVARHKPAIMLAWDDVNDRQWVDLVPLLAARNLPSTGYGAASLFGTGAKITTAQAMSMKNDYGWAWCLDSGPGDEPLIRHPTVAAAVSDLNAHAASMIASGLSSAEDVKHMCYSFGFSSYRAVHTTIASMTANGTTTVTVAGSLVWSGGVAAGMVVKGTGLGVNPTVISAPLAGTVVLSAAVPSGTYTLTFCGNSQGIATVCNGTTTITGINTTGICVGQEMVGRDVPGNTIVTAINVESASGQITVSNAVPATCAIASFILRGGEFAYNRMEDALIAAGYLTGRRVTLTGGIYTGFGLDPKAAMGVNAYTIETTVSGASAGIIGNLQCFLDDCSDVIGFGHYTASINQTEMIAVLDWIAARRLAGELDVLTIPQWYEKVRRRTFS